MTNKSNQQQNTSFAISEKEKSKKLNDQDNQKQNPSVANQQKVQVPNFVAMENTLGAVTLLAMKSAKHKYLFASDLEWLVMPAIALKQFVLFRSAKNEPIAFVSWAFVNDEVEQRILNNSTKLKPQDWKSGNKAYIMDIISPFNVGEEILKQLDGKQFNGKEARLIRAKKDGKGLESKLLNEIVKEFNNSSVKKQKAN